MSEEVLTAQKLYEERNKIVEKYGHCLNVHFEFGTTAYKVLIRELGPLNFSVSYPLIEESIFGVRIIESRKIPPNMGAMIDENGHVVKWFILGDLKDE